MFKIIYSFLVCFFIAAPVFAIENGDTVYVDYDLQGGVNNPNNITFFVYDSRGDDKYPLLPPTKEGSEFLGWYTTISTPVASNYNREKISSYDKPSSGNKLKIHARWGVVSKKPQMDDAGCMLVHDAAELYGAVKLADSLSKNACIFIENDIVVNENVLKSDGSVNSGDFYWWKPFRIFSGIIEGNGHTISGLYGNVGLVEYTSAYDTYIQNLGIIDSYFSGDNAGAFVSSVVSSALELKNVYSSATVVGTNGYVGGLIGYVDRYGDMCPDVTFARSRNPLAYVRTNKKYPVNIENSYCTGYLVGEEGGGLVGALDNISIKNSFYAGKIDVTKNFSGIGLQATKTCQILSADDVSFENVFYPEEFQNQGFEGTPASTTEFADGTILEKLKNGAKIPIWIQSDADAHPKLSGAYYNIVYSLNGGTNDTLNPDYYTLKQEVELLPASKKNDVFEGWFTDSLFTDSAGNISKAEGNQKYYAKWESWYSITYINDGDYGVGNSSNPKYSYADSTTLELMEPTGTGRTFDGWYTDSTFTTRVTKLPQGNTEDIVLVGKWLGREITIIYELYGGTMGDSTNPEKVLNGEKIRFKNPTREGYVFKGWNYPVEGHTYLNSTFTAYSAKYDTIYIYAEWTLEPIKPSVDSSGCYLVTNAHEWYYFDSFTAVYLGEKPPTDACIKIMEDFAVNEDLSELEPNHSTYGYVAWNCLDFTGTLYGNGHTISGLVMHYYSNEKDSYNGLFLDGRHDGKNPAVSDLYIANFYYNAKLNKNKVLINSKGSGRSGISRMITPAPLKQIRSFKYDVKGRSMKKHPNYGVFF